jgi:type I restriction enzyme, S subunit
MKWEKSKLTDFLWFQRGFDLPKEKFVNGDFPVVGSTSILGYHNEAKVKSPGIVTGRSGTIGQFQFLKTDFWPHNTSLWVKNFFGNDERFAYYLLHTLDFNSLNGGGAVPSLNRNFLSSLKVNIPPLSTQRKIASILSAYDDLIENNLKRIKLLEEKAFLRYKQIVREEKLNKHILSDFGEIITGKTPSTTNTDYFGEEILFIKTPDMHNQIFIEHTDQRLSELGAKSQDKKFLPTFSLCVSCIGTAGVVGITSNPCQTNQQINSIVFLETKNVYFFYALMSQMKEQLNAIGSNGSTFTNVNKSKFENMEVFVPNKKILEEFANEFEAPFKLILNLQKQNTKLREARDILLPRLMNGQIEV